MMDFLADNLGTVIVGLIVAAGITLIAIKLVRDKKKGKSSCGCGCEHCASAGLCHKR